MACWLCMGTTVKRHLKSEHIPEHARNKNGSVAPKIWDSDTLATHIAQEKQWVSWSNQVLVC